MADYSDGDSITLSTSGASTYSTDNYTLSADNSYVVKKIGTKFVILTDVTNSKDVSLGSDGNESSDTILSNLTA